MPKELIVSVNGREKKIAIIENESVTEFYIERGEEHQGIVGNIYKGRVMRVLPGMQSAFVDIGLDRDAFLYVSDFFDEEEEFERIVMDKRKKGEVGEATRVAAERIEQARLEREHHIEATQERAEPLAAATEDDVVMATPPRSTEPALSTTLPINEELAARDLFENTDLRESQSQSAATESSGRGRRRRRRSKEFGDAQMPVEQIERPAQTTTSSASEEAATLRTPFIVGAPSFERIVDEDERAAEDGEMFKDARLQERIFNQIHAVEFDLDGVPTAGVGSVLTGNVPAANSFQRIDDSDMPVANETAHQMSFVQPAVAADISSFLDEVAAGETSNAQSFERVSDDDELAQKETNVNSPRGKRAASSSSRKEKTESSAAAAPPDDKSAKPKRARKEAKATTKKATAAQKKSASTTTRAAAKGRKRRTATKASDSEDESYTDAQASISSSPSRGEFATRRGGRRRRRSGNKAQQEAKPAEDRANGEAEHAKESVVVSTPPDETRRMAQPEQRGGNGFGVNRRERQQPTITDLLRDGQEVLVQIAKEPIAKKGARITSHIALPGRFLVYMPTVEHVGVSRKIESDRERARLRSLIQAIRAEEDVPSGGFIVRTAGVGVSEEDLRDDARYLVRTWRDIRRNAEKIKAPALAHRDLDLVQRILRDQLSDDFTAIRVDSEEEYLRIVEFINRIQPRMVKRVKLYTREQPILEAYGVQAEIDKAIKPRVWLKSGGYLVINQTEALVAIDVNTGKFVGRGGSRLEDTITKTNLEAVEEIVRQIRLRDLGGIIVLDLIDMEDRRNRNRVMHALQEALQHDKSPTKVLSFNDFGLVIMTRKRVKQSLERTLCAPCPYCTGAGLVKSPQTICYEILEEARRLAKGLGDDGSGIKQATLRLNPEVARALRTSERDVLTEIEDYLGAVDITSDAKIHQEQFDFAFV
jgi:ribonuclease G